MRQEDTEFIERHRALVISLTERVANLYRLHDVWDEIVAYGMEGLLEARARFDDSQGAVFTTYAWYLIRGRMIDGLRDMGRLVRPSRSAAAIEARKSKTDQTEGGAAELDPELDRQWSQLRAEETLDGSHAHLHLPLDQASERSSRAADESHEHRAVRQAGNIGVPSGTDSLADIANRLDEVVANAATLVLLADTSAARSDVPDPSPSPAQLVEKDQTHEVLLQELDALEDPGRTILRRSFFDGHTLQTIGEDFGLSVSWTSRLRKVALDELKKRLQERFRA